MQFHLESFTSCGAAVVALCPQRPEHNQSIVAELGLDFPVLQDPGNIVATAFGLALPTPPPVIEAERLLGLDLPKHNGSNNWDLPMPARYVIDGSSTIRFASVQVDHRNRSDPQECLPLML